MSEAVMATNLQETLQWHDLFDQAFGVTASDCSDFLDWPGKTTPSGEDSIASITGRPKEETDWNKLNRVRGQVKFDLYKSELMDANPDLAPLDQAKIVFLMRSKGEALAMPEVAGGLIRVDALWLSFASFAAQSLFVAYPAADDPNRDDIRLGIAMHFATRALLYEEILLGTVLDKGKYEVIWETWPLRWDDDGGAMIFTWTALGRFLVAHEMAHLLHHHAGNSSEDDVMTRGIVQRSWIEALRAADGGTPADEYVYEVEADLEAIRMCLNMFSKLGDRGLLRSTFLASLYYKFLCLEELSRRVGIATVFPHRRYCIGQYVRLLTGNDDLTGHAEEQFNYRAKLYFDVAEELRQP